MRKFYLQLIFIFSFLNTTAQTPKFEIGSEIGLNFSNYYYIESQRPPYEMIKRISFGIVTKFNFSKNWALKTKLKYEGKGSQTRTD